MRRVAHDDGRTRMEWRDRLVASDPGLNRFRMAASGVVAMASVLGIEFLYGHLSGAGPKGTLIAMLLGAVVAMMGSMGLNGSARNKATTAVFFPVAIGIGMVLGAAVAPHHDLLLGVFVLVMFAAVYVRRFGLPFFIYGFMGWMGYFFASFLGASFSTLPKLLVEVIIASAWILVLSSTALRNRPERNLDRTLDAFGARARAVAAAAAEALEGAEPDRWRRRLRGRQVQLTEAALMIEGQLGDTSALPLGWSATDLRRWLLDAHLAVDGLAMAALALSGRAAASPLSAGDAGGYLPGRAMRDGAARVARALAAADHGLVEEAAGDLAEVAAHQPGIDDDARYQARHLAIAALDYTESLRHWSEPPSGGFEPSQEERDQADDFEPAVTLMMGNLPGSAAVAKDVVPRARQWNPLGRLDLTTRQAIQVALAGGLAILAGRELSSYRYYWAVIAAFVVFSGTATASETLIKGANRVLGTVAGLGLAILLAHATAGNTPAVLVVILASMFFGFYLFRVSYAFMIFFITIMVAQLYSVLHEFTNGLLVLRLEETAIGAAIGIIVALLFLPVNTEDTARVARASYFTTLAELLDAVGTRLERPSDAVDLDALARALDSRFQQLNQVLRPLTRSSIFGTDPSRVRHRLTLFLACTSYARELSAASRRGRSDAEPGQVAGGGELGDACRSLAGAATELAQGDPGSGPVQGACEHLDATADTLLRWSGSPDGPVVNPVEHALSRLHQGLRQLAGSPDAPAADAAPVPSTPGVWAPRSDQPARA